MARRVYRYYAIFNYDDDGISIHFPDLPGCISCGYSHDEAVKMAKDALELYLEDMQEENIPKPSLLSEITIDSDKQKVIAIQVEI